MLSLLRRWGARAFPSNSRARRRQAGSPLQGPPGTRPVRGLRTLRSFVSASVPIPPALQPLSARPPATSALMLVSRIEGVRGRKVPVRRASVLLDRPEPAENVSAVRGACRLTQLRCWVVPCLCSSSSAGSVRRAKPLHSSVSLRLVYPGPLFLHTSAGKNPARSVPGSPGAGVPPAGADSVSLFRVRAAAQTATDCAGGTVQGLSAKSLLPSFQQWAVPAQAPEAVCHPFAPVSSAAPGSLASPFRGAPEPAAPFPSRPPPGPRSTSFRALWHWQTHSRRIRPPPQPPRLRDCQHHRPTRRFTPRHQCDIDRYHPPEGTEKGINIYSGRQRLPPLQAGTLCKCCARMVTRNSL